MRQCLAKRGEPALSPINPQILKEGPAHCLALCLSALEQTTAAAESFQAAIAADPKSRPARFDFARFLAGSGKPLEAFKWLNELASENPNDLGVWQLGGQLALSKPEFLAFARDWTGEAIKHCPVEPTIILQRAEALLLTQNVEEALPLWTKAHSPKSSRHLAALVLCEIVSDGCKRSFPPGVEPGISQEFQEWYVRLINSGANPLVYQLHESMDQLRLVLPTFAAAWERATNGSHSRQTPVALSA
jgi:tetratricopeptide (TPR) repeat protein